MKPVKRGEEIIVEIEDEGERNTGVARYNNFVIIVNKAIVNRFYKVKIKKVFESYAVAEIIGEVSK